MANEYKFRGTADMSAHDKAITKSANEVRKYKQETEKSKKELTAFANNVKGNVLVTLAKFGTALGAGATALELVNKTIKSSQTTSDAWDATMRVATTTANNFFTAIATGDFTSFINGLDGIKSKAEATAAALDSLGNARISYNYFQAKNSAALREQLVIAKDKRNTQEERDAAIAAAKAIIGKQEEYTKSKGNSIVTAIQNLVTESNLLNGASVTMSDVDQILELDLLNNAKQAKKFKQQEYNLYLASVANVKRKYGKNDSRRGEELQRLAEEYKIAILYNELLVKMSDEQLTNIANMSIEYDNNNRALSEMYTQMLELTNSTAGVKTALEGSIAYIEDKIKNLEIEYKYTTDNATRQALLDEINNLKNQKILMQVDFVMPKQKMAGATPTSATPLPTTLPTVPLYEEQFNNIENKAYDAVTAVHALANAFNILSSATTDSADNSKKNIQVFGSAITQILPQIASLIAAQEASALASGTASAAKVPFPANLVAIASIVATIGSVFSQLDTFASGGIIGGNTTIGDYNIARVNSGEMILNGTQQSRLFNLLNSNTTIGNKQGEQELKFRISGSDLVALYNVQNNRNKRII